MSYIFRLIVLVALSMLLVGALKLIGFAILFSVKAVLGAYFFLMVVSFVSWLGRKK